MYLDKIYTWEFFPLNSDHFQFIQTYISPLLASPRAPGRHGNCASSLRTFVKQWNPWSFGLGLGFFDTFFVYKL